MKNSRFRVKRKSPREEMCISHKYGPSTLDPDYPTCSEPGCGNKASCALVVRGRVFRNRICVLHWQEHDRLRAGTDSGSQPQGHKRIKKGSITNAVINLIESCGKKPVKYEEMRKVVLGVKPTSKFNKNHFNWYMNQWKKGQLRRKE